MIWSKCSVHHMVNSGHFCGWGIQTVKITNFTWVYWHILMEFDEKSSPTGYLVKVFILSKRFCREDSGWQIAGLEQSSLDEKKKLFVVQLFFPWMYSGICVWQVLKDLKIKFFFVYLVCILCLYISSKNMQYKNDIIISYLLPFGR